jgi:hypothetical protein
LPAARSRASVDTLGHSRFTESEISPSSLASAVRGAIRAADPSIHVYSVATMEELTGRQTAPSRFTM